MNAKLRWIFNCESCGSEYDLVERNNELTSPHFCPHCGFDLDAEREKQRQARQKWIDENPYYQLWYCLHTAHDCGINEHPQKQMMNLGYKLLNSIPQSIADGWEFTVDRFIEPLPPYLRKIRYTIGEP